MSKLTKGYGSGGIQAILGDIKTYFEGKLAQKANTSDLGTASSRNATNQITAGSTALPEADAVKTALDSKEESGVAETIVKDTVGWSGVNQWNETTKNGYWLHENGQFAPDPNELCSNDYIEVAPSEEYYFCFPATAWSVLFYDENKTYLSYENSNKSFVTPNNCKYITFNCGAQYGNTYHHDIAINYPAAITSYEPYHATVDTAKADKVTNATSGNLAGLDSNGNLTDSGVSPTEDVTVEGNPVTFESPFEQDAKSVVVSVKPIQDLHGYDKPWVGGAGKNKLPLTVSILKSINTTGTWNGNTYNRNGVSCEVLTDESNENVHGIKVTGTASNNVWFGITPNTTDVSANTILSGCPASGSGGTYCIRMLQSDDTTLVGDDFGSGLSISSAYNDVNLYIRIASGYACPSGGLTFYPMIRFATESDATFVPYSNICPISGIDEVEIGVTGKNLCGNWKDNKVINYTNGNIDSLNGYKTCDFIQVSQGQKIYIQSNNTGGEKWWYNKDKTPYQWAGNGVGVKTSPIDGYFAISVADANASTTMVKYGESGSEYEPYVSHTTTIPLPSTLYDGDVDVTNGDADDNKGFVEFDGTEDVSWQLNDANPNYTHIFADVSGYIANVPTTGGQLANTLFNEFKNKDGEWVAGLADLENGWLNMTLPKGVVSNVNDFKAWLVQNPLQICYTLATPTAISFTSADVELLEGTNVVTTNGEKVAVTYKAGILATLGDIDDLNDKVKTKFDKANVATIEPRSTASKTYYKGDYIVRSDGCLYDVTATIASGAAFTNNNTHKTNLGDELNKFKVYVSTADSPVDGNDVASVSISGYLPISPFQVFSWSGSGTVSITPKSSGGTWSVSGDVSNVRYGQIFMRT